MNEKASSSGDRLRAAATGQQVAKRKPETLPQMLEAYKIQVAAALPKHINPDRMLRVALSCFRQTPKLADCDPASVFAAVVIAAQLGLEPGVLGQGYLIPYGRSCTFVPGWQGYVDLVARSGRASCWTGAVYRGDTFKFEYGSNPNIYHVPSDRDDEIELTHCYAVGKVKESDQPIIEVWSAAKITKHRDRFNKVGKRHYSYEHFEMYGRKIALLQVLKYLPKSVELANAIGADYSADRGHVIDIKEAIDNVFLPPPSDVVAEQESSDAVLEHDGNGKPAEETKTSAPSLSESDAIAAIKAAPDVAALEKVWKETIVPAFKTMSIDIEATKHDRMEFLKSVEARKKGEG